jgi:YVTN family beta-propeller protein
MRFGILGPFEVIDDQGRELALAGHKQRAVLAILVLHADEVVSSERLIDELWGERPPATAAKTVQVYVSNLRKALGDGLLATRAGGYVLLSGRAEVDIDRFQTLVGDGRVALRAGDPHGAARLLREALALWRGPPLADFAYERFARSEISQLDEARLAALEDRVDAELAIGEHAAVVGELEALSRDHPLCERPRAQLMLALYRSGRQAEALEVYGQARRLLSDDLGLEPGEDLKRLHRAILAHDPALDLAAVATAPVTSAGEVAAVSGGSSVARRSRPPAGGARRSRPTVLIAASVGLGLIAAAIAAVLIGEGGRSRGVKVVANSVAIIDPSANRVVADTSVGAGPGTIAAGVGGVWVANTADHSLSNIDPVSRRVTRTLSFGDTVDGVAADSSALWTVDSTRGVAARIDPTFRSVLRTVRVGDLPGAGTSPNALAVGGGAVWVANDTSAVVRIPGGSARVSRIDLGNEPSGIAIGEGATWVADDTDGTVSRIDPTGGASTVIPVGQGADGIAVGAGAVWVADPFADSLVRIDPTTDSPTTTINVGSRPRSVAWGDGSIWVANSGDGTVSRVDPQTDRVTATIAVAPDLAKARSLAAGVRAHGTMYTCSWAVQCTEDAQIVQTDLAAIGINLDIKKLPNAELLSRLTRRGDPWDIAFANWGANFPDPADTINTLFDPASTTNFGRFNDPAFTRRMRRAATLSGDRRIRAYARLDNDLTRDDPPAAAWGNGTFREFFSARAGCQIYQPIYGVDLGSICLRR